jgi:hypothetical protein
MHSGNGLSGLRELIDSWNERNKARYGEKWVDTAKLPNHFVTINHVPVMDHGIVLLTTDGDFAQKLRDPSSSILTSFKVKVNGGLLADKDPETVFKPWKKGVSVAGIDYGRVFVKVLKRSAEGTAWLRIELVASKERDVSKLLYAKENLRVTRKNVEAFGPYLLSSIPPGQVSMLPFDSKLGSLVSPREIKSVFIPTQLIDPSTGKLKTISS